MHMGEVIGSNPPDLIKFYYTFLGTRGVLRAGQMSPSNWSLKPNVQLITQWQSDTCQYLTGSEKRNILWNIPFFFWLCTLHVDWASQSNLSQNLVVWEINQNAISPSYNIIFLNRSQCRNQKDEIYATILVSTQSCNFQFWTKFMNSWSTRELVKCSS